MKKQSQNEKIKFAIRPEFGFLFCVHGDIQSHMVLELLDSKATYIWSFDKTERIEMNYIIINEEIGKIVKVRRKKYRSEMAPRNFHYLSHKKIETDPEQGFQEWKNELESKIV